jgi:small-conductance mechanosensitive channel
VTLALRAWSSDSPAARTAENDLYEVIAKAFHDHRLQVPYATMNVNLGNNGAEAAAIV